MLSSMHSSKKWYHKENVFGIHVDGSMTNTLVHIQDFKISTHQSDWQSYLRDYRIYVEFFISRWSYANFQDDYFIFNLWAKKMNPKGKVQGTSGQASYDRFKSKLEFGRKRTIPGCQRRRSWKGWKQTIRPKADDLLSQGRRSMGQGRRS